MAGGVIAGGAKVGMAAGGGAVSTGNCGLTCGGVGVQCDDDCNGCAGCGDGYDETMVLSYVGNGKGDYATETTYNYVGAGIGDFDMIKVPINVKANYCFCGIVGLLVVLTFWLVAPLMSSETTTTTISINVPIGNDDTTATTEPYNCETKDIWSWPKKHWCCLNYGTGCVTTAPPQPAPYHPPFHPPAPPAPPPQPEPNCAIGAPQTWDAHKRTWCCIHHHVGCPTTPCPYDCNAGFSNWERGWSGPKKIFCCAHFSKGCPVTPPAPLPPAPTTSLPFDCNAGYHGCYHCLIKNWSIGKLAWCCQHMGRGCPTTPPFR